MAHGFFTIEQWKSPKRGAKPQWVAVAHLNGDQSLSAALREIEERGEPGFYRVVQTLRQVWAETVGGNLRMRKWHAMTPDHLARTAEAFDRDGGRWPEKHPRNSKRK
jgi:hypothetical protein